jgi:hypothetical protein
MQVSRKAAKDAKKREQRMRNDSEASDRRSSACFFSLGSSSRALWLCARLASRLVTLSILLIALVGCTRAEPLYPVEGIVTIDGKPLVGGPRSYVVFQPDRKKGNDSPHEPKSTIDANGHYKLMTVSREGARAGWYKVRVDAAEVVDLANPYVTKWLVAKKYIDFGTSGLAIEVVEKPAAGAYDLSIDSKD